MHPEIKEYSVAQHRLKTCIDYDKSISYTISLETWLVMNSHLLIKKDLEREDT